MVLAQNDADNDDDGGFSGDEPTMGSNIPFRGYPLTLTCDSNKMAKQLAAASASLFLNSALCSYGHMDI